MFLKNKTSFGNFKKFACVNHKKIHEYSQLLFGNYNYIEYDLKNSVTNVKRITQLFKRKVGLRRKVTHVDIFKFRYSFWPFMNIDIPTYYVVCNEPILFLPKCTVVLINVKYWIYQSPFIKYISGLGIS